MPFWLTNKILRGYMDPLSRGRPCGQIAPWHQLMVALHQQDRLDVHTVVPKGGWMIDRLRQIQYTHINIHEHVYMYPYMHIRIYIYTHTYGGT